MPANHHWQQWEMELLTAGAREIPGRTYHSVWEKRKRMGLPPPRDGHTQAAQAKAMEAAFWACRHQFVELPRQSFPAWVDAPEPQYAAVQVRVCSACGCSQSRLWTVNGYATEWHQPLMPTGAEVS